MLSALEIENTEFYIANKEAGNRIFSPDSPFKGLMMIIRNTKTLIAFLKKPLKEEQQKFIH